MVCLVIKIELRHFTVNLKFYVLNEIFPAVYLIVLKCRSITAGSSYDQLLMINYISL